MSNKLDNFKQNLVLDEGLPMRVLDWHGGMYSALYSLGSTAMENTVSIAMIQAAADELSDCLSKVSHTPQSKQDKLDSDDIEEIRYELARIVDYPDENIYEPEDEDHEMVYSTHLMSDRQRLNYSRGQR